MSWIRTRPTCWNPTKAVRSGGGTSSAPWINSPGFLPFDEGRAVRQSRSHAPVSSTFVTTRANRARSEASLMSSPPQLADSLGLRWVDQKFLTEIADVEQALDLADHATQRELALVLRCGPVGNEQSTKPGTADIGDVLEIDDERTATALHE